MAFVFDSGTQFNNQGSTVSPPTMLNSLFTNQIGWEAYTGFNLLPDGNTSQSDVASVFNTWRGSSLVMAGNVIAGSTVATTTSGSTNFINAFNLTSTGNFAGPATNAAGVASSLGLTSMTRSLPNFGANGATVNVTLYQPSATTPGKGQAYTGAGTTTFADPGADLSQLPTGSSVTVTTTPTTTTLTAPASTYPSVLPVTVTVQSQVGGAGTPTGQVSLFISGGPNNMFPANSPGGVLTLDGTGTAVFQLNWLLPGNYTFAAVYSGDSNFASSSTPSAVPAVVSPAGTSVHLTLTPTNPQATQPVTITAQVTSP